MRRLLYLALGLLAVALGGLGILLPLLPTVPFMLLAAFFFAKSSPRLEAWLLEHPGFGPHIRDWRDRRAVSRAGKRGAIFAFAGSAIVGLIFLPLPWSLVPLAAALIGGTWIARRPT